MFCVWAKNEQDMLIKAGKGNLVLMPLPVPSSYDRDRMRHVDNDGGERRSLKVVHLSTHDIARGCGVLGLLVCAVPW